MRFDPKKFYVISDTRGTGSESPRYHGILHRATHGVATFRYYWTPVINDRNLMVFSSLRAAKKFEKETGRNWIKPGLMLISGTDLLRDYKPFGG